MDWSLQKKMYAQQFIHIAQERDENNSETYAKITCIGHTIQGAAEEGKK